MGEGSHNRAFWGIQKGDYANGIVKMADAEAEKIVSSSMACHSFTLRSLLVIRDTMEGGERLPWRGEMFLDGERNGRTGCSRRSFLQRECIWKICKTFSTRSFPTASHT